ncbi:MAG: 50S ribosomal protein L11 methyltransferase [Gammaproteobacteria bacterium]|nr:50S ribosomal protein L11 methyltransferase [Gammaproteobacteria bacterium]
MLQLRVQINAHASEQIETLLFACGAVSVSYEDAADEPILEPSVGDHPLWSHLFLQAHFTSEQAIQLATKALENDPSVRQQIFFAQIEDHDWQAKFQQQFSAMQFGPLWIYPSWEDNPAPDGISLQLDPGLAFGTGRHATTSLCLSWLSNVELADMAVIDFGCGSGILALAASRLGASHVHAVDIDPQAVKATQDNIKRNQLDEGEFTLGTIDCLAGVTCDIIIANILAAPLIELREVFFQHLKADGILVISGILHTQTDLICQHYSQFFRCNQVYQQQEWACISFTRLSL